MKTPMHKRRKQLPQLVMISTDVENLKQEEVKLYLATASAKLLQRF